ncbi:MAG: polysaccharide biosynthesis protein [Bradymonadaceae bacterium]
MTNNEWRDKRVVITGVCGTVGAELFGQVVDRQPAEIIGLDHNESELFFLRERYRDSDRVNLQMCDIRDRDHLLPACRGADVILHSAAHKHVILCEQAPSEAVETNIRGVENVIAAANEVDADRVLFTSSDKAVNPTNVMGTSKLMGERLLTAANAKKRQKSGPIFASTRFGNVLGSRGSVIPLFKEQIEGGGPVTLTDPAMTRFIMTLEEATQFVLDSVFRARGGEVFVTKMTAIRIEDLAEVMIEELAPRHGYDPGAVDIDVVGAKPGEKICEELINAEETRRTVELEEGFAVLPAFKSIYHDIDYSYPGGDEVGVDGGYTSADEPAMSKDELRAYLNDRGLLEPRSDDGR